MKEHKVKLVANEGIFRGLAKQNMLFHQCVGELVDNAIAAKRDDQKFKVDIVFIKSDDEDSVDVYVADNSKGMNLDILQKALQLGESATTTDRLNEHGFGMKNALATLSGENGYWKIWTKPIGEKTVYTVEGPFKPEMCIREEEAFPTEDFLPSDISTLIKVSVKLSFIQTVQGRGAPTKDLAALRTWLIEHLGVFYRGYLEQDPETFENTGTLVVSIGNDSLQIPPIPVPLGRTEKPKYFDVEIGGKVYKLTYKFGTLDEVKRDSLVRGEKTKYYYQGNIPTQGIDIRLGKRVIATRQFETIWKTEDRASQLSRHNRFNDFLGELLIPELPRGVLSTTNNKTDFNLDDPNWINIFNKLNEIRPIADIREKSEKALRKKWMRMLKATNPDETITDERSVWPTGTKIDVYRKKSDGKIIIYELKVGTGSPIHLYQLKMYWDGLVLQGEQPKEGILLVEGFSTSLEEMANQMNQLSPPYFPESTKPSTQSNPYNLKIERHKDKGL